MVKLDKALEDLRETSGQLTETSNQLTETRNQLTETSSQLNTAKSEIRRLLSFFDLFTTSKPKAVFSTRRLNGVSYPGPHVRVRRSSDAKEVDVMFDSLGVVVSPGNWNTWSGGSTLYITKWYDQSGSGNDVIPREFSENRMPTLEKRSGGGKFDGLYAVKFGSQKELTRDIFSGFRSVAAQPYTVISSFDFSRTNSNNANNVFAIGAGNMEANCIAYHPGFGHNYHWNHDVSFPGIEYTDVTIALRYDGQDNLPEHHEGWHNGVKIAGVGGKSGTLRLEANPRLRIGGWLERGGGQDSFEGQIYNIIFFDEAVNENEIQVVTNVLNSKYVWRN